MNRFVPICLEWNCYNGLFFHFFHLELYRPLNYRWYRKLFGGKWRFLKLGKDTPYCNLFCTWTKMGDKYFEGYKEVLATETYKKTNVKTRFGMFVQFFKNLFS